MWIDYFLTAFLELFPIFMIAITISGLAGVFQIVRIVVGKQQPFNRDYILGTGLFALFVGLLVFPVESFQLIKTMKVSGATEPSIVMGGFYITFVPMLYGIFWFIVLSAGWLYFRRKE